MTTQPCRCGHPYAAHAHLRPGTECVTCARGGCGRYRPLHWWSRLAQLRPVDLFLASFVAIRPGGRTRPGDGTPGGMGPAVGNRPALPADDTGMRRAAVVRPDEPRRDAGTQHDGPGSGYRHRP